MRPQHITAENQARTLRSVTGRSRFNEAAAYHCGKRTHLTGGQRPDRGFNEAAAYHCGKLVIDTDDDGAWVASMRPQHITAENPGRSVRRGVRTRVASMRPQHITAENTPAAAAGISRRRASMRPQHITAENTLGDVARSGAGDASMRPQHITAENPGRGRLGLVEARRASMRPQHITAENATRAAAIVAGPNTLQ